MLSWANFQRLIKPCNPIWMPSCRNYNQPSTKWTTAMHMQQQCKIDIAHPHPFILHLTYNGPLHNHLRFNTHLYHLFIHNTGQLELDLQLNITESLNGCHHHLDFMDTTQHKEVTDLEWLQVDADVDVATDLLSRHGGTPCFWMQRNYTHILFKSFNNWYYCFISGYDTDHEGINCPWVMCILNHNTSVTRANAHLFPGASLCWIHKATLPRQWDIHFTPWGGRAKTCRT